MQRPSPRLPCSRPKWWRTSQRSTTPHLNSNGEVVHCFNSKHGLQQWVVWQTTYGYTTTTNGLSTINTPFHTTSFSFNNSFNNTRTIYLRVLSGRTATEFVNLNTPTTHKVNNVKLLNLYEKTIFFHLLPYPIDDTSLCTDDFDPLVKEQVLPLLPLHPDTCIVRQEYTSVRGYYINFFVQYNNTYPNSVPMIVVYAPADYVSPTLPSATQQRNKVRLLYSEIHELCHINQGWYVAQALQPDNVLSARPNDLWYATPAGKEFIALTEFQEKK